MKSNKIKEKIRSDILSMYERNGNTDIIDCLNTYSVLKQIDIEICVNAVKDLYKIMHDEARKLNLLKKEVKEDSNSLEDFFESDEQKRIE